MIQYERQQNLLRYLENKGSATVKELAAEVYASEASVRRDLNYLETQGIVKRVYGGVILTKDQNISVPLVLRSQNNIAEKEYIAKKAATHLYDGATVFIDSSSTAGRIVKYLGNYHNLKIITNSMYVVEEVSKRNGKVWATGGKYIVDSRCFVGLNAENFIKGINIDLLFFSSQGLSEDGTISDSSESETSLRRTLLERSEKKIFLCDSSKIGVKRAFLLCTRFDVDMIICDKTLPWESKKS